MKQTVHFHTFQQAFEAIRPDNFSYEGLTALFDYLEAYEDDTGEELELDVIALCCDFSEDWADNIAADYGIDIKDAEGDPEAVATIVRDYLQDEGAYIGEAGEDDTGRASFVYRQF